MSTDAPAGGVEAREDLWDAEWVVAHDRRTEEGGQIAVTVAAEHVATGRLVGFTELAVPRGGVLAWQEDTLVLRDHRGHRLGLLLKAFAVRAMMHAHPTVEQVVTYNAEENRPMLDVNELMGFRPLGHEGTWQLRPRVDRANGERLAPDAPIRQ